jgi:triphosphoribosyl-dephospho-CoA synthase
MSGGECLRAEVARLRIERAFLHACGWDVAVRKPGNVSRLSPGHGMQAQQFLDSAQACVAALTQPGASVGARIEGAVEATWARVGCNTNLGIVLLCAPIAAACERLAPGQRNAQGLRAALQVVLAGLDREDAAAAFRAIVRASPGGLGDAPEQDVREPPRLTLREAMGLAADRDRIARQYRDGAAELFSLALPRVDSGVLALSQPVPEQPAVVQAAAVQRVFLSWLASAEDSHIVRKWGSAVAQTVLSEAKPWAVRAETGALLEADPAFMAWDDSLKTRGLNPGTSADLTVATLMLAAWLA